MQDVIHFYRINDEYGAISNFAIDHVPGIHCLGDRSVLDLLNRIGDGNRFRRRCVYDFVHSFARLPRPGVTLPAIDGIVKWRSQIFDISTESMREASEIRKRYNSPTKRPDTGQVFSDCCLNETRPAPNV